jgi:predicted DNA-binding protein
MDKTQTTKKPKEAQMNIRMPEEVRRRAKAQSALTGRPVEEVITELIEKWLDEEQRKEAGHERTG